MIDEILLHKIVLSAWSNGTSCCDGTRVGNIYRPSVMDDVGISTDRFLRLIVFCEEAGMLTISDGGGTRYQIVNTKKV